ncbi:MAG: hypothetical protein LBQ27_05795 [Clostridiales bacterium]|jgi:tetratricopeptide (TPR) repeat protein|nr:hypothetical protein [Clostridiales bacterium]
MAIFDLNDYETLIKKAEELFDQEKIDEAFIFLNRAYEKEKSERALILYAKMYYEIGAFDYAVQKCRELKLMGGGGLDVRYETAVLLFKIYFFEGNIALADACFEELKSIEERDDFEYKDSYDFDGIDAFLDYYKNEFNAFNVIDKKEEDIKGLLNVAVAYVSAEKYSDAVKLLKEDLERNASAAQHNMLVLCYINLHKYKLAEGISMKMLKNKDMRLYGILNLINLGIFKRDLNMKYRYIAELKKTDITDEDDLDKVVGVMTMANCHEETEFYVRKLLELRPYDLESMFLLACALYNQKKRAEAKAVYKQIYEIYGDAGRAQFFLRYCDSGMEVYYNAPLPLEYFGVLSNLFESVSNAEDIGDLLSSAENRELVYLALRIEELREEVFNCLMGFLKKSAFVTEIFKRFFKDISASEKFKEYAAFCIMRNNTEFDFEYITHDCCAVFHFNGATAFGKGLFNDIYCRLLARLLSGKPEELKNAKNYADYIALLDDALNGNDEETKEKLKVFAYEKCAAGAAAVYFKVNYLQLKYITEAARFFSLSDARVRKAVKVITTIFE